MTHLAAATVSLLFAAVIQTATAGAAERVPIAGTPVTVVAPGFAVAPDARGLIALNEDAMIGGGQMPDLPIGKLIELRPDLVFEGIGAPPDATVDKIAAGEHTFHLISFERVEFDIPTHVWVAHSGPDPTVVVLFRQMVEPPKGPPTLNDEVVREILSTIELEEPIPFEQQLLSTDLDVKPLPPFAFNSVIGDTVVMSTAKDLNYTPNSINILISFRPFPVGAMLDETDACILEGDATISIHEAVPMGFADRLGVRCVGEGHRPNGKIESFIKYGSVADGRVLFLTAIGTREAMTPIAVAAIDAIARTVRTRH